MVRDPNSTDRSHGVPDGDTPESTEEAVRRSVPAKEFLTKRGLRTPGRPRSAEKKISVSLRLDPEVVAGFKADGPGWQTRMNAVLAESLKRSRRPA